MIADTDGIVFPQDYIIRNTVKRLSFKYKNELACLLQIICPPHSLVWVDPLGVALSTDNQEILNNIDFYSEHFRNLKIEVFGAKKNA